jgi:glycosyltransferase involved in cell wall biosynthesis
MRIGILGTRGIPNHYSGYEQFAEFFAQYMVLKGHDISVYSSSLHTYQETEFHGVKLIHQHDPEDKLGTFGQFIYDLNCIRDSRKRDFDLLLLLGYTSSSIWGWHLPKNTVVVSNMDGLEWKRSKYNWAVQQFLKFAEYLAIKTSDFYIADSKGIQSYLKKKYAINSKYIAYGVQNKQEYNPDLFRKLNLKTNEFSMLIARMEPENNIETILDGFVDSGLNQDFIVIGNPENKFGKKLQRKYQSNFKIKFIGPIYDLAALNYLRRNARYYFHGHSVGGTNPSLLEAMASKACICAHDNAFNKSILEEDAFYFKNSSDIAKLLNQELSNNCEDRKNRNYKKVIENFSWDKINADYESFLFSCLNS